MQVSAPDFFVWAKGTLGRKELKKILQKKFRSANFSWKKITTLFMPEKSKNHIRNANLLPRNQQEMAKIEMICDSIQLKTCQDHIFGQPCPSDIVDFTLLGYLSAWSAGIHWLQTLMAIWGASSPVWLGVLTNSHEKTSSRFFPERLIDNLLASHQQFTKTHINLVILSWNANKL